MMAQVGILCGCISVLLCSCSLTALRNLAKVLSWSISKAVERHG